MKGSFLVIFLDALGSGKRADVDTRKRELLGEDTDILAEFLDSLGTLAITSESDALEILEQLGARLLLQLQADLDSTVQEPGDRLEIFLLQASRSKCCSSDTDTTRDLSGSVTADGVLVDNDASVVANLFRLGASEANGAQVPEDEVVVGTLSLQTVTPAMELSGQHTSVVHDLLGVSLPGGLSNLEKGGGDAREGVIVGTTLAGGENSVVDTLLEVLCAFNVLAEEDETSAGSTEGLVTINWQSISYSNKRRRRAHVVVVTTWQCSNGLANWPPAIKPDVWAMSHINQACCSSAVARSLL